MKKQLSFWLTIIFFLIAVTGTSLALDTSSWFEYNGLSTTHSYSVKFPTDWKVKTFGDDLQGFSPKDENEAVFLTIQEFEGKTYTQAINSYLVGNNKLVNVDDKIFSTNSDMLVKEAAYHNSDEGRDFAITFIKRGSLIVAITNPNLDGNSDYPVPSEHNEMVKEIFNSFRFTDNWHQYIDFQEKYTFVFPKSLNLNSLSDGVELVDAKQLNSTIFSLIHYPGTKISEVAEEAEGYSEELTEEANILFHGFSKAIRATYYDEEAEKELNRIFVEQNGNSYGMTDINIATNFPHLDYYDQYIIEILESFEFFDISGNYSSYLYFPDVRDDHENAQSINFLTSQKVVAGYPDGTFKPDGEINRAELTKMIVASELTPDAKKYKDCFPDVKNEWFAPFVCYAKEQGWVAGYPDGTFKPEQSVNRAEALKIIFEVSFNGKNIDQKAKNTLPLDVDTDDWYASYFIFGDNNKLLDKQHITTDKDGYFYHPSKNITRKEVAETIYRSIIFN